MLTFLTGLLITVLMVLLFGLTIFVHELGHFLAARKLGLVVDVFSIGFGPALWQRRLPGGLRLKIGWIPLGGYVALPQLDPTAMDSVQNGENAPRTLPHVSPWRKIVVAFCGAAGNVVLALILAHFIALNPDVTGEGQDARVGNVTTNSAAYAAGLRAGHIIRAVNGQRVRSWDEFQTEAHLAAEGAHIDLRVSAAEDAADDDLETITVPVTRLSDDFRGVAGVVGPLYCVVVDLVPGSAAMAAGIATNDVLYRLNGSPVAGVQDFITRVAAQDEGHPLRLELLRQEGLLEVEVTPVFDPETGRPLIGVVLADMTRQHPPWMQYRHPWKQISHDARSIFRLLRKLVAPTSPGEAGRVAGSMGGPILILVTLWLSVRQNLLTGIGFVRFLNVNLAILNLLPIPVLDGGHILFSLWEWITGRKPNARVINVLIHFFVILLLIAVLLISRNDVLRLWRNFRTRSAAVAVEAGDSNGIENGGTDAPAAGSDASSDPAGEPALEAAP